MRTWREKNECLEAATIREHNTYEWGQLHWHFCLYWAWSQRRKHLCWVPHLCIAIAMAMRMPVWGADMKPTNVASPSGLRQRTWGEMVINAVLARGQRHSCEQNRALQQHCARPFLTVY